MAEGNGTESDPAAEEWAIYDQVVQLRVWGTSVVHPLPAAGEEPILGASDRCSIRIDDPSRKVSRRHARVVRTRSGWAVRDLSSKNGIRLDGAQRPDGPLHPGTELGLGGVVLIAESKQLIALRDFLARLLGWDDARRPDVDRALRAVRLAATHRAPLLVSGEGDLVPLARSLHDHARGGDKPFVLCDPRRRGAKADVRLATNITDVRHALQSAVGGSLCLLRRRMPRDASAVLDEIRSSNPRVQLIVCMYESERIPIESLLAYTIDIPPLAAREHELGQIISEYAMEAMRELRTARSIFTAEDHEWVRTFSASSLSEIEKGTRRLVALRADRTLAGAAARLKMAPVSLSRWLERRDLAGEFRFREPRRLTPRRSGDA
ncbi:MAG TPA: FHA domain-containing protein [Kofleriaceae bacterium]